MDLCSHPGRYLPLLCQLPMLERSVEDLFKVFRPACFLFLLRGEEPPMFVFDSDVAGAMIFAADYFC